jgi:rfaE bifunctional protein kinase chain/domain
MVRLANTLSLLKPAKIMVIGDLLLDSYTFGKARRLSPEAPVAIIHVHHEEHRPGGAGNVALNLISLEAQVVIIGRVGNDWAGEMLSDVLGKEGVNHTLYKQVDYKTPVKNRVIAENQQIVRIDHEQQVSLNEQLEQQIINDLPLLLKGIQIIALSDYGKGFLTDTLLQAIIKIAKELNIKVVTDPKGHQFHKYLGTTIIKPNLSEAYAAANLPSSAPLEAVAQKILETTQAELLMITRSESGISLFDSQGGRRDYPVEVKEVKDVTGAGDTVLAMLSHALANQLSFAEAAELCNVAAGIAIEHVGCARITLADLAKRLLESNLGHKVFDHSQLFVLQKILKDKGFNLLIINAQQTLTTSLYQAIKKLSQESSPLIISIKGSSPQPIFIDMLASLKEISFILIHQENDQAPCHQLHPASIHVFEQEQLKQMVELSIIPKGMENVLK